MRGRRRLGVALLLDPPASVEVEGLRRALGDTSLGHVAPHLTLVPPVNVRAAELDDALRLVRLAAAAEDGPIWVELGPVETFVPVTPVVYLAVGGPDIERLGRLKSSVLSGPLLRTERWPWVPHVTLADEAPPEQAEAALQALAHYRSRTSFDRVVILEEQGRHWHPLADTCFGPPRVVGRGGLELEITEGRLAGPDVMAMAEAHSGEAQFGGAQFGEAQFGQAQFGQTQFGQTQFGQTQLGEGRLGESIVLTGRREGRVAGFAAAWHGGQAGEPVNVGVLVDSGCRRQGVGRALVVALELSVRKRGWALEGVHGHGPEEFFRSTGGWVHTFRPGCL